MSFFKKLFGLGGSGESGSASTLEVEHKEFQISVCPIKEGGNFRISAVITKQIDGELKTHTLIRADTTTDIKDANEISLRKAKQIIDEQGERIFR